MAAIEVNNLQKTFRSKRKSGGMRGTLRSLIKPDYQAIEAVRGLSFSMESGELLGFIGPNGAGKSTTIKILTGILFPSGGEAKVLGYIPWDQRRELAYHIGTVFGQRPQLWYHLPAIDTFYLFGKIYEIEDRDIKQRIGFLSEAFELNELLETPVRKLSLGQRMRCEVAASLLHKPKLLLLDEPSIGLDVVAKQHIRDTIRTMSQVENVGVLLTSHDAGDLEALCKRVIIKTSITTNGVIVSIYTPASYQLGADASLEVASEALRVFSERFSPYPYSELDLVTTPTLALGIEYPGIIAITEQIMVPDGNINNTPVSNYLESTVAHEVGHQWFYNMVGNDQLNDPWLDESLTQYATLQYYFDRYGATGAQGFRNNLENRWSMVDMAEIPIGLPVREYTDNEYSAIVYGRGGLFLEALRDRMGQKAFDDFLKDYSISYSWDITSVDKFKALAEKHCNCKLEPLFQEWVYP